MALSLYDISVANYLQTLGAVAGFLDKGAAYCASEGMDPGELVETRLVADMMPLRFQIVSVAHHSLGALKGAQAGVFKPPASGDELDYAGLQALVGETRQQLQDYDRATVDALEGKDMVFELGANKLPFVAENFILSFSLPNFYFHATTAYDILRHKGVPLGKRDFMGQMRMKG
jgi:hypothetical protein